MSHRKHKTFPCSKICKPLWLILSSFYHVCWQKSTEDLRNKYKKKLIFQYHKPKLWLNRKGIFSQLSCYLFIHSFDYQDRRFMSLYVRIKSRFLEKKKRYSAGFNISKIFLYSGTRYFISACKTFILNKPTVIIQILLFVFIIIILNLYCPWLLLACLKVHPLSQRDNHVTFYFVVINSWDKKKKKSISNSKFKVIWVLDPKLFRYI